MLQVAFTNTLQKCHRIDLGRYLPLLVSDARRTARPRRIGICNILRLSLLNALFCTALVLNPASRGAG